MAEPTHPAIPLTLAHLPTVGGLAVPWITARTAAGHPLFGALDLHRKDQALQARLCGVCGQRLTTPLVLLMRLSDLPRLCTAEPPVHPVCAAYTASACPMVRGSLGYYRSASHPLDPMMIPPADTAARRGAAAEPWFAVWLRSYTVITDHGTLAASYAGGDPLRIRPIGGSAFSA
ncbi:hypothetical protein [Frankia sp. R82]|uniref:hypothetical protein n=1 Tax=Frankia sp. R82 TaxID=2950553 RepID=UPI0020434C18|nr:hypothetical protein [Frankia sp. R82]MCM3883154.1 hypothetical protein [Frankia sp. R82]